MEKTGHIEIKVEGKKGNITLSPEHYDIRDIEEVLQHAAMLLYPNAVKDRPTISYRIEGGSVRHILSTSLQVIIGFNALMAEVQSSQYNIDFLEPQTAKALDYFQQKAEKTSYSFSIGTSLVDSVVLRIDKNTRFIRSEDVWAEASFYFYGIIVDAGGKSRVNVHLDTREYGLLKISATKDQLAAIESNLLYKKYGLWVSGKQNVRTGDIDDSTLVLNEIMAYTPGNGNEYLKSLIGKAKSSWTDVPDVDDWLQKMRGYGA